MTRNGRPVQKHCCLLQEPSGSQEVYSRSTRWDLWLHWTHQCSWALSTEEEGWLVTVWLKAEDSYTKAGHGDWGKSSPRLQRTGRARHEDTTPVAFSMRNQDPGSLVISFGLHWPSTGTSRANDRFWSLLSSHTGKGSLSQEPGNNPQQSPYI